MVYNDIFTSMIGFVTWPPFSYSYMYVPKCYEGDQVTKPIILVKICCKLLYVIQVHIVKYFDKVTFWPQLISKFLVTLACLQ